MTPTRRDFVWSMGATAAALYGLRETPDVFWAPQAPVDPGWAPGVEQQIHSTCLICPSRCGIRGRVVDGRLVQISGNPLHPMSRGGVCPRGIAGVQVMYHPDRIETPLVRTGERGEGKWEPVSQETALDRVGERLRTLRDGGRPESLALLSGYCAGSMQELWRQFLQVYGSPNYVADDYDDGTRAVMDLMHGIPRHPGYDLEQAEFVLSFGAPLFGSWWSPVQAFVAFGGPERGNGRRTRFVHVDTRFSRTAARAHEWVGVRPGTHAVLALGIAYVLIRDERFDVDFVSRNVAGFEDWTDERGELQEGYRSLVLRNYRTEEVTAVTGVPVERVTSLARALAESNRPLTVFGTDVMSAPQGLLAGIAVHSLNVLTGSINRRGGVIFGDDPPLAPLAEPALDPTSREGLRSPPVTGRPPPFGTGSAPTRFAEAVTDDAQTPIEALFLYYANPLASSPRPAVWRQALQQIPFIVSFSPFLDETTRHADVILPDLLPFERWQDAPGPVSYPHPVWGVAQPVVAPREGAANTGDVVLALARALGGSVADSLPYEDFKGLLESRAHGLFSARRGMIWGDEFERQHHRQMQQRGWWLPESSDFDGFWNSLVERGGWTDLYYDDTDPGRLARTPSGRIDLMPSALRSALDVRQNRYNLYVDVGPERVDSSEDYPLRLLPYRVSTLASGTMTLARWLAEQPSIFPHVHWVPWVEVAPETASELGFGDGANVWVVSRSARYRARLKVFPGTAPENVCVPYGLRYPGGERANPLELLDDTGDPLTGIAAWSSTFVRLEPA